MANEIGGIRHRGYNGLLPELYHMLSGYGATMACFLLCPPTENSHHLCSGFELSSPRKYFNVSVARSQTLLCSFQSPSNHNCLREEGCVEGTSQVLPR